MITPMESTLSNGLMHLTSNIETSVRGVTFYYLGKL